MLTKFDMAGMQIQPRITRREDGPMAIRLPGPQEFFRVCPEEGFSASYNLLEDKQDKKVYVVHPDLEELVGKDAFPAELRLAVNRDGEYFFLYCKYPSRPDEPYTTTRLNGVDEAQRCWVRLRRKDGEDGYEIIKARGELPEPVWPKKPFLDLLSCAASDRVILEEDHPILMRLLGDI